MKCSIADGAFHGVSPLEDAAPVAEGFTPDRRVVNDGKWWSHLPSQSLWS